MRLVQRHLTFANVVSVTALFVALAGTAMAATIITSNDQVATDTISGHSPPSGDQSNLISHSGNGRDLAPDSITSAKIAAAEVQNADLGASSVDTTKIADGQVQTFDLADNAVTTSRIADGQVQNADLVGF